MRSSIKHIQIIVSLLKGYGIKKIVLSGGTRNIPFSESVIHDPFFECFYHFDERTAAYFALGLAVKSKEIVVLSCTSGTALANYVPAIAEAYYQHVPLLVLSADRRPLLLNQNEDQMINQPGIFDNFIKMSIDLPEAIGPHTRWGCRRLICEGINELTHHNLGPVHINYRIGDEGFKFEEGIIDPDIGIKLIQELNEENVTTLKNELSKYSRIAILCGQSSVLTQKQCDSINNFCDKYNAIAIVDALSNAYQLKCKVNLVNFNRANPRWIENEELLPDLVIQINGRTTFGVNGKLRAKISKFDFWLINNSGFISDLFKKLDKVIECKFEDFFNKVSLKDKQVKSTNKYFDLFIKNINSLIPFPRVEYSNLYVTKRLIEEIPEGSLLHLGILDSLTQGLLFANKNIECYSNRATWGIDGSLATFMGQACLHNKLAFIIIGDLSFFYGMNALMTSYKKGNLRILINNNNGTSTIEDNANRFKLNIQEWGKYQGSLHNISVKGWVESLGYLYISANDSISFEKNLEYFLSKEAKPIVFEVFTDNAINNHVKTLTRGYAKEK